MRFTALNHIAAPRRVLLLTASAALLTFSLAACSSDSDEATGTPFTQALAKNYTDLYTQASALPAPQAEGGMLDSLDIFGLFSGGNPNEDLAKAFSSKADEANTGVEPEPEAAPADAQETRARLIRDLAAAKEQFPTQAAAAQADYDCWVLASAVPSAGVMAQACRTSLTSALATLENGARPTPPPAPVFTAPVAPVTPAPVAPVTSAPAANTTDFTVYFEFDSWTLTAEDLKVITDVINSARTGGQTHINIVGHTDTSGSAEYNQKLSVHRANVVVEALVDLGARRTAIKATGVGEADLAVATADEVKEAKNRRAVIDLQP